VQGIVNAAVRVVQAVATVVNVAVSVRVMTPVGMNRASQGIGQRNDFLVFTRTLADIFVQLTFIFINGIFGNSTQPLQQRTRDLRLQVQAANAVAIHYQDWRNATNQAQREAVLTNLFNTVRNRFGDGGITLPRGVYQNHAAYGL